MDSVNPEDFVRGFVSSVATLVNQNRFSTYTFVQTYGRMFKPGKWESRLMKRKQCFMNCANVAIGQPDRWRVGEGYAYTPSCPIPIEHAWLVDVKTGLVADPTWGGEDQNVYFGVEFRSRWVRETLLEQEHYGLLFHWRGDSALFRLSPSRVRREAIIERKK